MYDRGPLQSALSRTRRGIVRVPVPETVAPIRRAAASALSPDERERATRVALRLHGDLRRLVQALPEGVRGGSALARHLGIARNTCQRICHAIQEPEADLETLIRLPGVRGLEQFLERVRRKGAPGEAVDLGEASVAQFARLVDELAGSHAKLIDRLEVSTRPDEDDQAEALRKRMDLYAAAVGVTGRRGRTAVCLNIFHEVDDLLERIAVDGMVGSVVRPGGMPMAILGGDTLRAEGERSDIRLLDDAPARGRTPAAILEEFSTTPLPEVTGRGAHGELLQVIDPDRLEGETEFDLMIARRMTGPARDADTGAFALEQSWYLVNCPSRSLVFDVYLHEKLERKVRPAVDAMMWYPHLSVPGSDRWISRFPGQGVKLQLLGRGVGSAGTPTWDRHAELSRWIFDRVGLPDREFFGFRCEVDYPIWRAGYCITFEPADEGVT